MPRGAIRYVMPDGLGEYLVFRSNEETGSEYVEVEWTLPPGAFPSLVHRHLVASSLFRTQRAPA